MLPIRGQKKVVSYKRSFDAYVIGTAFDTDCYVWSNKSTKVYSNNTCEACIWQKFRWWTSEVTLIVNWLLICDDNKKVLQLNQPFCLLAYV